LFNVGGFLLGPAFFFFGRASLGMRMGEIVAAVEFVAGTGYGKAVRVFDLGPWTKR
jgi:hypothetical protein